MSPQDATSFPDLPADAPDAEPPLEPPPQEPQRYVPVLNEVIGGASATPASAANAPAASATLVQVTAQTALRALGPEFDQRLAQAISRALQEQLQGLHARVRQAIASEVEAAVAAALLDGEAGG